MNNFNVFIAVLLYFCTFQSFSQNIEILSFNQNPLEISPLLGGDLQVNIQYTSLPNSTGNNIYVGLEELDINNQFVRTIDDISLENEPPGTDVPRSVILFVGSIHPLSADLPNGHYYQVKATLYSNTWSELAYAGYWNTPPLTTQNTNPYNFTNFPISKGADVSWMTEMEAQGFTWQDNEGNSTELMPLLKDYDLDAVRLRVWVNPDNSPANGWCDIDDMLSKAQMANAEGLDVMICIHFSDHWADPGQQTKPAAWANLSITQLQTAVANHTTDILNALNAVNITPKWVQIGNETNDGMLWPEGRASTGGFANYAGFVNAGANAVKTFNPSIKTILHLSNGFDQDLYNWNINGLINNGLNFNNIDVIGMSLYPEVDNWKTLVDQTYDNMQNIQNTFNKEVMVVEIGFSNSQPDITYQFIVYMIEKTRQAEGLGVFYWEPIAYSPFTSYSKGAWDDDGSPSVAFDAFKNTSTLGNHDLIISENNLVVAYPNPVKDTLMIKLKNIEKTELYIYNIQGKMLKKTINYKSDQPVNLSNFSPGIYFLKVNSLTLKIIKL